MKKRKNVRMEKGSVYEQGYGMIPKRIMRDKRLTVEAKAIYAYICSFAGAGNEAFPSISLMVDELNMGKERFYKHMKILVESGYIAKRREITENNLLGGNIYELIQVV